MSRYINADKLEEKFDEILDDSKEYDKPIHDMMLEFYFAPTEDVEPVRHGRWVGKTYKCSICGKWIDPLQGDADMNYCPNCGAKMDGEERKPFIINKECYLEPTVDKNGIPCMAIRKSKEQENE